MLNEICRPQIKAVQSQSGWRLDCWTIETNLTLASFRLILQLATLEDNSFEKIFSELETKCGLSREKISELIRVKKENVGGGYLTDQGALFLVAADLGVILDYGHERPVSIAGLGRDRSASIICRILSYGPPKTFIRKSDSKRGSLVRATLYDDSATITASFWDNAAIRLVQGEEFRPGALVKISDGYIRAGLDGSQVLNIGESESLESSNDEDATRRVKSISDLAKPLSSLPENAGGLVISGTVDGDVKKFTFSRSDGTTSDYTSFYISDRQDQNLKRRVVLWGFSNPAVSLIGNSNHVTLVNVRTKLTTFQNTVSPEIHGDDTTIIMELWTETKEWLRKCADSLEGVKSSRDDTSTAHAVLPFVARVASIRRSDGKVFALLMDSNGKKISATITGDAVSKVSGLTVDTLLVCKPETQDVESGKATFTKSNSLVESQSKRKDIPMSNSLVTSIEQLGPTGIVSLDVMCLTDQIERDIQTKEGLVRRSEITVADHTGEMKVYGWRALSKLLEGYSAGDRILVSAAEVQTHEGKKFIILRNYSAISKNTQ